MAFHKSLKSGEIIKKEAIKARVIDVQIWCVSNHRYPFTIIPVIHTHLVAHRCVENQSRWRI